VERVGRLLDHAGDEAEVERAALLRGLAQQREQRDAVEVLHHDVELAVSLAELVDLTDIRVRQPRGEARLGDQHLAEPLIVREVREDPFDDEQLLEPGRTFEAARKISPMPPVASRASSS